MAAMVTKCIPTNNHKKQAYGSYPVQMLLLMRDEDTSLVLSAASKPPPSAHSLPPAGPTPTAPPSSAPAKPAASPSSPAPAKPATHAPAPQPSSQITPAPASAPASPLPQPKENRASILERFQQSVGLKPQANESNEPGFELVEGRITLSVQEPAIHLQLPRLNPALRHFKVSRKFFRGGFPFEGE